MTGTLSLNTSDVFTWHLDSWTMICSASEHGFYIAAHFSSDWNKTQQQQQEENAWLPGNARRRPRKLAWSRNTEACEHCPAALLSKCQLVMCHLFKSANSTSTSNARHRSQRLYPQGSSSSVGEGRPARTGARASRAPQTHYTSPSLCRFELPVFFKICSSIPCQPAAWKPEHSLLVAV